MNDDDLLRALVREHGTQQLFFPRELPRVVDVLPDTTAALAEVPALCGNTISGRSRHVSRLSPSVVRPERQNLGLDGLAGDRTSDKDNVAINACNSLSFAGHGLDCQRHKCSDVKIRPHQTCGIISNV